MKAYKEMLRRIGAYGIKVESLCKISFKKDLMTWSIIRDENLVILTDNIIEYAFINENGEEIDLVESFLMEV